MIKSRGCFLTIFAQMRRCFSLFFMPFGIPKNDCSFAAYTLLTEKIICINYFAILTVSFGTRR
jgi:hypothetical protein